MAASPSAADAERRTDAPPNHIISLSLMGLEAVPVPILCRLRFNDRTNGTATVDPLPAVPLPYNRIITRVPSFKNMTGLDRH